MHCGKTHVLLGSQRSGLPEYVVSSLEVKEHVELGEPLYVIKLNAVKATPNNDTYDVPEMETLLQEFNDVLSGVPVGLPPSRAADHSIRLEPDTPPPEFTRCLELSLLNFVRNCRSSLKEVLFAHQLPPMVHPSYLSQRRMVVGVYVLTIEH